MNVCEWRLIVLAVWQCVMLKTRRLTGADYGLYKVEAKTKSSSGVDFTVNCSSNHDTKKFVGSLETKYKWSDYGTTNHKCYRAAVVIAFSCLHLRIVTFHLCSNIQFFFHIWLFVSFKLCKTYSTFMSSHLKEKERLQQWKELIAS